MLEINKIHVIDCLDGLRLLDSESVHCGVTSPPYYGLRDYGVEGQIGLETTPEEYIARLVEVFHEFKRVLRDDGTLWVNIGDSYANDAKRGGKTNGTMKAVAPRYGGKKYTEDPDTFSRTKSGNAYDIRAKRNKRDVWTVSTQPFSAAHFATFPPKLIEPCILAGCPAGGVVCDPFMGSGTTAQVATELQRNYIGFELNPKYVDIANKNRLDAVQLRIV